MSARRIPVRRGLSAAVFLCSLLAFAWLLRGFLAGERGALAHLLLAVGPLFALTTVGHDAAHSAVLDNRRLNDLVGWLCGLVQGVCFPVFRKAHLLHHSRTQREGDPDLWCHGRLWQLPPLPLRWASGNWNYYRVLPRCPRGHQAAAILQIMASIALVVAFPREALLGWVLPAQAAIFLFAVFSAWLPHGVYGISVTADSPRWPARGSWPLQILTLFHEDHHLRPAYPFHQYPELYLARRAERAAERALERAA